MAASLGPSRKPSFVKQMERTGFAGVFLCLNLCHILCNANIFDFDCVPLNLVSLPNASSQRGSTCSRSGAAKSGEIVVPKRFPSDLAELYVPLSGFTLYKLTVYGVELDGLWIVVDREFRPAQ